MTDIVERLFWAHERPLTVKEAQEAAAEIERLRAEVARLVKSRNKWGQKYNQTLEKLKLAVWTDTEEVKAANEAATNAVVARDEAVREVSRLGRDLGTTQARLAEAVEMLHRVYFASRIDVLMEGPRLQGWNRPELDRLWPELRDLVAKLEQKP